MRIFLPVDTGKNGVAISGMSEVGQAYLPRCGFSMQWGGLPLMPGRAVPFGCPKGTKRRQGASPLAPSLLCVIHSAALSIRFLLTLC